ncbi:hypothetical protein SAMN04489844_4300 [Nocardioides exalbidus]|uniref:Uncharacterized protein n=1 Tax=Nocardioides exalbidus TaxID=402596 RepID=A0A1H5A7M2_9ACTN|nr:hypothetical protein [Nocardioides exalbidus]SED38329.1 hypothetical protein SAMN04489844_4300 [Nocardioides exalbidus]
MGEIQAATEEGFTVSGDGRFRGDDEHGGELAGMTLYVVRALVQVDQLLGLGALRSVHARGGRQELAVQVGHEGDFGLEVTCALSRTGLDPVAAGSGRPVDAAHGDELGDGLDAVMDQVCRIDLVAGCFVVSASGTMVAERVPGIDPDGLSGTGRRMRVAFDAFDRFLGTTSLVTGFEWVQMVAAPVGNGLAVAIADLGCDPAEIASAIHVGGGALHGVDLASHRSSALAD